MADEFQFVRRQTEYGVLLARYRRAQAAEARALEAVDAAQQRLAAAVERTDALHPAAPGADTTAAFRELQAVKAAKAAAELEAAVKGRKAELVGRRAYASWHGQPAATRHVFRG
jgi:hypothetical protein